MERSSTWVCQLADDLEGFEKGAGPAMREEQGDGVGVSGALMHKVELQERRTHQ